MIASVEPYTYSATIRHVVDGDTFDADVQIAAWKVPAWGVRFLRSFDRDLGFYLHVVFDGTHLKLVGRLRFRVLGLNTPEKRGEEREDGLQATVIARQKLPEGSVVSITTHKGDAFGRWLAEIETPTGDYAEAMIVEGWGVPWDGRGRRPRFVPGTSYPLPRRS